MSELTSGHFLERLDALRSPEQLAKYERFFPPASRGDDVFIGVAMGQVFALAKEFVAMPLDEVERLLDSPVHEARVGAVSIMDYRARSKRTTPQERQDLFDLYLRRHDRINTWDLVDRSAIHVVGDHLRERPRDVLYRLAGSERMPERRTAIVATFAFVMAGETADAFAIAELLLDDDEDLIQKATGWVLRATGRDELLAFLDRHAATMPRVTLRAAVEKLEPDLRRHYLGLRPR